MGHFAKILLKIREKEGFSSALSFYRFLTDRDGVTINYAQYKKIELGKAQPQPEFVRRLAKVLPEAGQDLIYAFCLDTFPDHAQLFKVKTEVPKSVSPKTPLLYPQEELTPRQISIIAKSIQHYATYFVLTLARNAVNIVELKNSVKGFSTAVMEDFITVKLVFEENDGYRSSAIERKFPAPTSPDVKQAYARMDQWDMTMHEVLPLQKVFKKSMFRRVSVRYLSLLSRQAEILAEQFTLADEVDATQNNEAMSLILEIRKGTLPG